MSEYTIGDMTIYEMPYGAEMTNVTQNCQEFVTVTTVEEAKLIIESLTRFIESRDKQMRMLDLIEWDGVQLEVYGTYIAARRHLPDEPGHPPYIEDLDIRIGGKSVYNLLDSRIIGRVEDTVIEGLSK